MTHSHPTVREAVVTCLALCRNESNPHEIADRFLELLAENPHWCVQDLEDVRALVSARLSPMMAARSCDQVST